MFVNSQDTTLLHGALMSAVNSMQSSLDQDSTYKKVFQLRDKKGLADIVSSTVLRLTRDPRKVKSAVEFLRMQQHVHRRLHSAVFFVALRSNGITCTEANKYYESLPHNFPSMDWRFYLRLNYQCSWSEYFIECAVQLEPDVLASVIKGILPLFKEDDLKCYTWHLALQSIIWKFFQFDDPAVFQAAEDSVFDFPFTGCQASQTTEHEVVFCDNPSRSKLLFEYVTIVNHMLKSSSTSFDFLKTVLHFYKTTFKLIKELNACNVESIKELFRMNVLQEACFKKETFLHAILSSLSSRSRTFIDHIYATTSWEISGSYLLFLLFNYLKDAEDRCSEVDSGCLASISSAMPQVNKDLLFELCPIFKESFGEDNDPDLELLKAIFCYDYTFASRAAGIILMHPEIRNKTEIMDILKENLSNLLPSEIYPVLADTVVETELENKSYFLNLFFKLLSSAPNSIYNDALNYIIDRHGVNEHFKLPDTNFYLVKFERKTMLLDEAENLLLPLFIQEPLTVLKSLIEQALIRGAEGIAIIPVLKLIPSVCSHKDSYPLINELSRYFLKENLLTYEEKYITSLVETIMQVQTEKEILSFDRFLEGCILPSFYKNIRIDLTLECLNVSLRALNNAAALKLSDGSFFALMECLTLSVNECIQSGNGKRKELLLLTLSLLGENKMLHGKFSEGSPRFIQHLSTLDQVVTLYLKPFCNTETYRDTVHVFNGISEALWIYCCQSENPEEFRERLSSLKTAHKYDSLLSTLCALLSHFTKKEWTKSADFLKEYFEHFLPTELCSSIPSLLPKTDYRLYAVVRTLMDCYIYLVKKSSCDKQYMTSCFTNTVMDIVGQKSHPQLLLNVFLDACHVASFCETDTLHLLSSFLISIKKSIFVACDDKSSRESYLKLALTGVKCLPDSIVKNSLLQKF